MPSDLNINQTTIQLQLSFLIANQVHRPCRLLEEAAVEVEETGHGQDNKRSAGGLVVFRVPSGGTDASHL